MQANSNKDKELIHAIELIRQTARKGNPMALAALGFILDAGCTTDADAEAAILSYKQALTQLEPGPAADFCQSRIKVLSLPNKNI